MDSSREALVIKFKGDLVDQTEALTKEVADIRLLAQHDMILEETSDPQQVMAHVCCGGPRRSRGEVCVRARVCVCVWLWLWLCV